MEEKYYLVRIKETLSRTVKVKANSLEDAESTVRIAYNNCDIVLDADDFNSSEIDAREAEDEDLSLYEEEE